MLRKLNDMEGEDDDFPVLTKAKIKNISEKDTEKMDFFRHKS